ncbi:MAG: acyltransferase [Notoacmeibacter sp.]|nr:acyltransferase [Notoacmeibacter sp.]
MKYRADIDGLRTLAVVPVVLFHAGLGLPGGFVGVDVFFVISGFLITGILHEDMKAGNWSITGFYDRRIRRIFPALMLVTVATLAVASVLFMPADFQATAKSALWSSVFLSNFHFHAQTGYFMEAAELSPLLHTWSLSVEEQFYVVFPLLLWAAHRYLRGPVRLLILLAVIAAISFALSVAAVRSTPEAAFYLSHNRIWELMAGAMLAILVREGLGARFAGQAGLANLAGLLGLALIGWAVFAYSASTPFPGAAALAPCLGAVALIWSGSGNGKAWANRLLALPPMVFFGRISYSLYLWHWPVFVFARYGRETPPGVAEMAGWAGLSVVLATLSWRYIEQPFRDGRRFPNPVRVVAAGALATAVVAGASAGISAARGFPGRLDPELRQLLKARYMHDRRECHRVTPSRMRRGDLCIRGAEQGEPSFVLVGDSHADAASPAVFSAAGKAGLRGYQYTAAGFRPMPGVEKRGEPNYVRRSTAFVEFLKQHPELRTVIITGFWVHQVTGDSFRHKGTVWFDDGYDGTGTAYNATATRNGLTRLFQAFPERRFILLDDVASGTALDLKSQARRIWRVGKGTMADAAMDIQAYQLQRDAYEPLLKEIAAANPNVRYVPLFGKLCGADACRLMHDGKPVWRNGDHLAAPGAMLLESDFSQLFATQDQLFSSQGK